MDRVLLVIWYSLFFLQLPNHLDKEADDIKKKIIEDDSLSTNVSAVSSPFPSAIREECDPPEEERPKGEEKIKLRYWHLFLCIIIIRLFLFSFILNIFF